MAELCAEVLGKLGARVLEETAFVFAEFTDEAPPFEDEVWEARLSFQGAWVGEVAVASTLPVIASSVRDLLDGDSDRPSEAVLKDALGEIGNLLVGLLAAELFGVEVVVKLGLPRVSSRSVDDHAKDWQNAQVTAILLTEDGGRFDFAVFGACPE